LNKKADGSSRSVVVMLNHPHKRINIAKFKSWMYTLRTQLGLPATAWCWEGGNYQGAVIKRCVKFEYPYIKDADPIKRADINPILVNIIFLENIKPVSFIRSYFDIGLCECWMTPKDWEFGHTSNYSKDLKQSTLTCRIKPLMSNWAVGRSLTYHLPKLHKKYPGYKPIVEHHMYPVDCDKDPFALSWNNKLMKNKLRAVDAHANEALADCQIGSELTSDEQYDRLVSGLIDIQSELRITGYKMMREGDIDE